MLTWILVGLAAAGPPSPGPALQQAEVIALALERNPTLIARSGGRDRDHALARAARARPDPHVELMLAPGTVGSAHHPLGASVGLSQALSAPGQTRANRAVGEAQAQVADASLEAARQQIALRAVALYDALWERERAIELLDTQQSLVDELLEAARARYVAGVGSAHEPLMAELERVELASRRLALLADRSALRAELGALCDTPPEGLAPLPADLPTPASTPSAPRAELQAAMAGTSAAEAALQATRRASWPAASVMAEYSTMWEHPAHRLMLGVGAQIPLGQGARAARVEAARAEVASARAEVRALQGELDAARAAADARAQAAALQVDLSRDRRLPLAQERLDATRTAYIAGSADFDAVIEAARGLADAELALIADRAALDLRHAERAIAHGTLPGGTR